MGKKYLSSIYCTYSHRQNTLHRCHAPWIQIYYWSSFYYTMRNARLLISQNSRPYSTSWCSAIIIITLRQHTTSHTCSSCVTLLSAPSQLWAACYSVDSSPITMMSGFQLHPYTKNGMFVSRNSSFSAVELCVQFAHLRVGARAFSSSISAGGGRRKAANGEVKSMSAMTGAMEKNIIENLKLHPLFDTDAFNALTDVKERKEYVATFFSPHQKDQLQCLFTFFDKENNNWLTKDEIASVCHMLNIDFDFNMFNYIDEDGNGYLDFEEFLLFLFNSYHYVIHDYPQSATALARVFAFLDVDGAGQLSQELLRQWFRFSGVDDLTDEVWQSLELEGDRIQQQDFIRIMGEFEFAQISRGHVLTLDNTQGLN